MDVFNKLPEYYHKVADKYLSSHLKTDRYKSNASLLSKTSQKPIMSKSRNSLPKIRRTGQGMLNIIINVHPNTSILGIRVKPQVTTGITESRSELN
jgi:hypothetical protein